MTRLGSPAVVPAGCCIERTVKGQIHRYAIRAWHPLYRMPVLYLTREELAHFIGAEIPPRKKAAKPLSFPAARKEALA